jgi:hypothetical protein
MTKVKRLEAVYSYPVKNGPAGSICSPVDIDHNRKNGIMILIHNGIEIIIWNYKKIVANRIAEL